MNTSTDAFHEYSLQKKSYTLGPLDVIRERIIMVCPTICDALILTRNKTIEVAGGTLIVSKLTADTVVHDALR